MKLVDQNGQWGADVVHYQELPQMTDVSNCTHISVVISQQVKSMEVLSHELWIMQYCRQFPLLHNIACKLTVISSQSANVERVCKVHKLVHTNSRNREKNSTVCSLLYCYVNLRLIRNMRKNKMQMLLIILLPSWTRHL